MATGAMPLMLDSAMDAMASAVPVGLDDVVVDDVDLFGDPVVDLALPPHRPPSKPLIKRVDELRTRGSCQRIGWSRQGTIASIAADGHSIELRYLRTNPRDGTWGLSEPTSCTQFGDSPPVPGNPIVHLAWAATGSPELAVIDAVGRVSILTFSMNLNRPYPLRPWDVDPIDDLHAVVGSYWLPLIPQSKQYNVIHGPATREDHGYRYDSTFVHAFGPYHPNPARSALLCVTTCGVLKLFFSQNSNKVQDTSIELESVNSSDDLATHASICSEKGNTLLIALATASGQLKIVRAIIHWGLPQQDKQVPPQSMPLNPTLQHKLAAVTSWMHHGGGESPFDVAADKISLLRMLPSAVSGPNQPWSPPLVLIVRTYLPSPASPFPQETQSIIDRWELVADPSPQTLHVAFEQVGTKPPQTNTPQGLPRLHKLEPIVLSKAVISIHTMLFGKVICISFSDGTVQYRDRFTMEETYNEANQTKIMTLNQAGFEFANPASCVSVAFSPTNCTFVQLCDDGQVRWNSLKYPVSDIGTSPKDTEYAAVVAGLTTAVSTASFNQMTYDDILATARQFADKPRFAYDWTMEIVRMLKINVDYSEEAHHDQLVRNHSLQLCLSILNHMGFRGEFQPRAFCGKFAMLALNVRNIVILITIASNTPSKLNPLDEPEVVEALAGCAKWALDLLTYITDSMFNMLEDPKFMVLLSTPRFGELITYLKERDEVALHLLLCSSTRGFLSAVCRRLLHLDSISSRATQYYEEQQQQMAALGSGAHGAAQRAALEPLRLAYQKMQQYTSSSLIKVQEFDKLLWTLGEEIRKTYQQRVSPQGKMAGIGAGAGAGHKGGQATDEAMKQLQARSELTLLLGNNPPPSFQPMLSKFFGENVRAFRAMTDPAKLYFADYSILEVEDDERTLQARRLRRSYIDVFKRTELVGPRIDEAEPAPPDDLLSRTGTPAAAGLAWSSGRWRRCVRCTAVMEDVFGYKPGYTFVLAQQRKCSCGGSWGLLPRGTLVG